MNVYFYRNRITLVNVDLSPTINDFNHIYIFALLFEHTIVVRVRSSTLNPSVKVFRSSSFVVDFCFEFDPTLLIKKKVEQKSLYR